MSYIDVTGKTEEDAISNALRQLGMDRDDVSVEILERPKSGFLGLGSCPAKIRVTYGAEEPSAAAVDRKQSEKPVQAEKPAAPQTRPAPRSEARIAEKPAEKPAPKSAEKERPAFIREERPVQQAEKPAAPQTRPAPRSEARIAEKPAEKPAPKSAEKERPAFIREERPVQQAEKPAAPVAVAEPGEEVDDEKAQAIREFLSGLLGQMECPADIRVYLPEKGRYRVVLVGENLGALIGRRGETLDAIQQLTSYSVNRSGSGRVRIQLDAENYREKREQSLEHLAQKVAEKVVKYRRSVTLEPMNAYERHVIHTALQEVPCVTTYSTGTEPSRRVIVAYDREQK